MLHKAQSAPRAGKAMLIYRMGVGEIPVALFGRLLGRDVFYVHPDGLARREGVRDALALVGVRFFDFMDYDPIDVGLRTRLKGEWAERAAASIPDEILEEFVPLFREQCIAPGQITVDKIRICLFGELLKQFAVAADMEAISRLLRRRYARVLADYPTQGGRQPFLQTLSFVPSLLRFPRVAVGYLMQAIHAVRAILALLTLPRHVSRAASSTGHDGRGTTDVAFFLHQGPSYGLLFRYDYLYEIDKDSPLERTRVVHAEILQPSSAATRSYSAAGLSWRVMTPVGGRIKSGMILLQWLTLRRLRALPIGLRMTFLASAFAVFRQYRGFRSAIDFEPGSVAVVAYDILFPCVFSLALQASGVKVVAVNERPQSVFFATFHIIFDRYFVAGPALVSRIARNRFCSVGWVEEVGQVRADLLAGHAPNQPERPLVLVLDYAPPKNWWENIDEIINVRACKAFYLDIIRLAQERPDVDFLIRGKTAEWLSNPLFNEVVATIQTISNLSVDQNYSEFNRSYILAAQSQCIIAKHTSLGDECLSVGKQVIFHDWSENSHGYARDIYNYEGLSVFAFDYPALLRMLDESFAVSSGLIASTMSHKIETIYTTLPGGATAQAAVRSSIKNLLGMESIRAAS